MLGVSAWIFAYSQLVTIFCAWVSFQMFPPTMYFTNLMPLFKQWRKEKYTSNFLFKVQLVYLLCSVGKYVV